MKAIRNHTQNQSKAGALLCLALVWLCATPLQAFESLIENSPFLPPDYHQRNAQPKPQQNRPLPAVQIEFKGTSQEITQEGGSISESISSFLIVDKKTDKSQWVRLKDPSAAYYIESYDPVQKRIVVKVNGQTRNVTMATESNIPVAVAQTTNRTNARIPPNQNIKPGTQNNQRRVIRRRIPRTTTPQKQ